MSEKKQRSGDGKFISKDESCHKQSNILTETTFRQDIYCYGFFVLFAIIVIIILFFAIRFNWIFRAVDWMEFQIKCPEMKICNCPEIKICNSTISNGAEKSKSMF